MDGFDSWIGRQDRSTDQVSDAMVRRWQAALDLPQSGGEYAPQALHWCLCAADFPTSQMGPDGLRASGCDTDGLIPPLPQARRVWSASACEFYAPLQIGASVERISRTSTIERKLTTDGQTVLVTLLHEWRSEGHALLTERQSLTFHLPPHRDAPLGPLPDPEAQPLVDSQWDIVRRIVPDAALLLRYSALRFDVHRRHYDADYCREVEGMRGPMVQTPLIASLLLQLGADRLGEDNRLTRFSFRTVSHAIAGDELVLGARIIAPGRLALNAFDAAGRKIMEASAAYSTG